MTSIRLAYGADEPLVLEPAPRSEVFDAPAPPGSVGRDALAIAARAIATGSDIPPLRSHVVPGDRVAIALAGGIPGGEEVVAAVLACLAEAGVSPADTTVLRAPPLYGDPSRDPGVAAGHSRFDPTHESEATYLAADADGQPLHLARVLVDADVVVSIGTCQWDAALGGPSLGGELWPAFARSSAREEVVRSLARSGRRAVGPIFERSREVGWQLGAMASVRIVPGRDDSIHAVEFGTPIDATRAALRRADGWRPRLPGRADVVIAGLVDPRPGLASVVRAVAAAAPTVHPQGTVCLACRLDTAPGPVVKRAREGAPIRRLVLEALRSGDPALVADAFAARFLERSLGRRRLVLLSDLSEETVEDLGFGHASGPDAVARLARRAGSLVVLHDAERMFPRVGARGQERTSGPDPQ